MEVSTLETLAGDLKWVRITEASAWSKVSTSEVSTKSSFVVETGVESVRQFLR